MSTKIKAIDEYILKAKPFARPILEHLRMLVHSSNPEVKEAVKWGMPFFDYKGPYCNMAAFKEHVVFGFWKSDLMKGEAPQLKKRSSEGGEAMGNFGRITSLSDLPPDEVIVQLLLIAKKLNDDGVKVPAKKKTTTTEAAEMPEELKIAFKSNKSAAKVFSEFTPAAQREYIDWINSAKTDATRIKRIKTTVEWVSEGKKMNWQYK